MTVHNYRVFNLKFYIKIKQPTLINLNQTRRHSCFPKERTNEKENKTEKRKHEYKHLSSIQQDQHEDKHLSNTKTNMKYPIQPERLTVVFP